MDTMEEDGAGEKSWQMTSKYTQMFYN